MKASELVQLLTQYPNHHVCVRSYDDSSDSDQLELFEGWWCSYSNVFHTQRMMDNWNQTYNPKGTRTNTGFYPAILISQVEDK